jgi:hypothetical protein
VTHAREHPSHMHPYTHIHTAEMMVLRGSMGRDCDSVRRGGRKEGGGGGGHSAATLHGVCPFTCTMYKCFLAQTCPDIERIAQALCALLFTQQCQRHMFDPHTRPRRDDTS